MHMDPRVVVAFEREIYLVDQRPYVLWSIQFFCLLKSHFVTDYFHHNLKLFFFVHSSIFLLVIYTKKILKTIYKMFWIARQETTKKKPKFKNNLIFFQYPELSLKIESKIHDSGKPFRIEMSALFMLRGESFMGRGA